MTDDTLAQDSVKSGVLIDIERPFLPFLVSNWIFGIGIIEYPIRKPHRIISFFYTSLILIIFGIIAYEAYPVILLKTSVVSGIINDITLFFMNVSVTVTILISGWFQSKV